MVRERPLKIFTWHIHGSYLFYLSQGNYQLYIPVSNTKKDRNIGRGETFPFGNNVIEVNAEEVKNLDFDCILFQHRDNYLTDQFNILSEHQRKLPRIYLEHDTPREHPTNMEIVVDDPDVLIVHVTQFNRMMWDNKENNTIVIEHGVVVPPVNYKGNIKKGIVVINNLPERGRMLGFDVFKRIREQVPLDLVGMNTGEYGIGEVLHPRLPEFVSNYRFFFNPIRYTSMGLAVIEAMMIGVPVIGLATTEMPAVFNGKNGIVSNDPDYLVQMMNLLLENKMTATDIGKKGQITAVNKFNISRFINDWTRVFETVIKK
ncbi:MAG: glycosyltransferase family 4 protein [Chitinophagaceae bacterium]|nr:glycosyltransferase family 4 protein [Chitinophagaceae bacterium]